MSDHTRQGSLQKQSSLSADVQWHVFKNEQQYGPLRASDMAQLAEQGWLLQHDQVWRPGLEAWIAAGDVPGLFVEFHQLDTASTHLDRNGDAKSAIREHRDGFKERAKDQLRNFALMFLYLWVVFGLLAIHESIILSQHQINYQSHGVAIVNALIFAKVMLIAEDLHLGHRLNDKPLIYSIIFKSLLFGITLICFHIVEHVIIGMWDGKTIVESILEIGADKLGAMVSVGTISTVALVPFFILREISRVIGADNFWSLFFHRRNSYESRATVK